MTKAGNGKHEKHGAGNPAAEGGMSRDAINIGLNAFQVATAGYEDNDRYLLEWLWGYAFEALHGSKKALCNAMRTDYKMIYDALTGALDTGRLKEFLQKVEDLKKRAVNPVELVPTVITDRIIEALNYARDYGAMVTVKGSTGRGKTTAITYWSADNNHGRAKYLRIPSGCTRRTLVQELCRKCGIGVNGKKTGDLEWRLFRAFSARNVLIIDEAGHLMPRTGTGTSAIEFIRDLHDKCGCGVALIFTDVYLSEMKHGRLADYFEQFIGRVEFEVEIPERVRKDEVRAVVSHFHPTPPAKMVDLALRLARGRDGRLRTLFRDLERARQWAWNNNRQHPGDEDLRMAANWRKSGGLWPEDA